MRSLVDLMGCDLPVPDHTTLSRRRRTVDVVVETSTNKRSTDIVLDSTGLKFFGAGEWARAKQGIFIFPKQGKILTLNIVDTLSVY